MYALDRSTAAVLGLDGQMLADDYELHEFHPGERFDVGPFELATRALTHFDPNVGMRITTDTSSLAYTSDGGADPDVVSLAEGVALLLAESTFPAEVPEHSAGRLSSARQAGEHAAAAHVEQLVLTHLWPGADPATALAAAQTSCRPDRCRPTRPQRRFGSLTTRKRDSKPSAWRARRPPASQCRRIISKRNCGIHAGTR
ncbi:MAG: MBL fold metallo-hydrolase [Mycobacterium sp.]